MVANPSESIVNELELASREVSVQSLRDILNDCEQRRVAIGHFNISDVVTLRAIFAAAHELKVPVLIGVSEGERKFIGVRQSAALVKSLRQEFEFPIFLNADHTHSLEGVRAAAEAGFDEILFDGSKLPFEENARQTKAAVELAKFINPEVLVEGEIGYIGSSSAILDKRPEQSLHLTTPEEASDFMKKTGVDILAPAVGNMHGLLREMLTGEVHKRLNIARVKEIKNATSAFMTLHGGSGTADEDFVAAIKAGMNIVHINTELRVAWRKGVEEGLKTNPDEVAPYKILPPAYDNVFKIVKSRLLLFNS
jgi:fructose-bisphosphate aldolase, class II